MSKDKKTYKNFKDIDFNKPVELYTIQHVDQLKNLDNNGFITGDKDFVYDEVFDESYRWMIRKMIYKYNIHVPDIMKARQTSYYPIWFWYSWGGQEHRRPDLRSTSYSERGTELVLITFKKDWRDILLSDFGMWHAVLNKSLLDYNDFYKNIQTILDKNKPYRFYNELDKKYQDIIRESWNVIFDMDFQDPDFTDPFYERHIQGVTWCVRQEEILSMKKFICR